MIDRCDNLIKKAFDEKMPYEVVRQLFRGKQTIESSKTKGSCESYLANDVKYNIVEDKNGKVIMAEDNSYNLFFSKFDGMSMRFGKTFEDNPSWCPVGPEILDIEISVNGCPKINGSSCKFCYKSNSDKEPTNMTLENYKKIISKIPKTLSQVAIGITGVQTNPDFIEMLRWTREEAGIVPNYTLSGADLNKEVFLATVNYCGRVAVSIYESDKQLAYKTIAAFYKMTKTNFANAHVILSDSTKDFVKEVISDYKAGKIKGLRNLVLLKAKPVGRASKLDCTLSDKTVMDIIECCNNVKLNYGFDSCSAPIVEKVMMQMGYDISKYSEACESSRLSSYINVHGEYCHCSFCEHIDGFRKFNILDDNVDFQKLWQNEFEEYRKMNTFDHCPVIRKV